MSDFTENTVYLAMLQSTSIFRDTGQQLLARPFRGFVDEIMNGIDCMLSCVNNMSLHTPLTCQHSSHLSTLLSPINTPLIC